MTLKKYHGSCHCRAVRFEADIDLSQRTTRCNCSYCSKARAWFAIVAPEQFRQIAGDGAQQVYEWIPEGRDAANLHYRFCKTCGVRTPAFGDHGPGDKPFYFIPVSLLEDADANDLAASIHYADGAHGNYARPPDDIRLM